MSCNKCGYELSGGAGFCLVCGTAATSPSPQETAAPPPQPQPPQSPQWGNQRPMPMHGHPPVFQQPPPREKRTWSRGTAMGLILGIIGIVSGFFSWPLLGERSWFGVIFGGIAIVFGLIALICGTNGVRKKSMGAGGGIATGTIALCFGFISMMIFVSCNLNWTF
ncbi:MAG: DUF308 domain-containing protein [Firmicutes bacterium]|nr:DUF308 domain-containing protein [Bacillota bacterium]